MRYATSNNFTPRETLSWGTQFLMIASALMADAVYIIFVLMGIFGILYSSIADTAGAVPLAVGGCVAGAGAGFANGTGVVGTVKSTVNGCAAGAALALTFGLILDGMSWLLDLIWTAFVAASFWLWFKIKAGHGARRGSMSKRPLYMGINMAIKMILGFVPGWTVFAYFSIRDVKKEDAKYNKEMMQQAQTNYRTQRATYYDAPRYQRRTLRQQAA